MRFSNVDWCSAVIALVFLGVSGCDVPTGDPSLNTETDVNTPLVAEKTFSFLGGSNSTFEPLIDTTSSEFDSLFTVGDDPKDISVVQEVDNFDIGSLDNALDEAGGNLSIDESFSRPLFENSELKKQTLNASYLQANDPHETGDPSSGTLPVADGAENDDEITISFPAPGVSTDQVLEPPQFGAVDARSATVDSVKLTDETTSPETGVPVNRIEFTLTNNGSNTLRGKGGTGTPKIQIQDTEGGVRTLRTADFGETISPSETASATLDVTELILDESTQYRLLVAGTNVSNTADLGVDISAWRYQAAYLSSAKDVEIAVSKEQVPTVPPDASRFVAVEVGSGTDTLVVNNRFSFELQIDQMQVQNNEPDFGSIPPLGIDKSFSSIAPGEAASKVIDMSGRGIAERVNVAVTASPVHSQITVTADDTFEVANKGTFDIQTMYFRPRGETVQTSGTVELGDTQERVGFEPGDYVELSRARINVDRLGLQTSRVNAPTPQVTFDTLSLSYPDLRLPPYNPEDSLEIRFFKNGGDQGGPFTRDQIGTGPRDFEVAFDNQNIRFYPRGANNEISFTVRGTLEEAGEKGVINVDDQIVASTTVDDDQFTIEEIKASQVDPFTVEVTPDDDGDQTLDLVDDAEVQTASFDGFEGIADRIDGLRLANTSLNFSIETQNLVSTDAQLYAAIQGTNGTGSVFLAGAAGTERGVSSVPFQTTFAKQGQRIRLDSLIRVGVDLETANMGRPVNRTKQITGDNSNVGAFINALPTEIRFAGQAEVNQDGGDLQLRRPVTLDAGFSIDVPLQIKDEFVVRDTIDADFADLRDLTDPDQTLTVSAITLEFGYENGLPLGADLQLTIAGESGEIETFSGDKLRIQPAPRNAEGAAEGTTGQQTATLNLGSSQEALRDLADGEEIQLRMTMTQASGGAPARLRADDTIRLDLRLNVDASIQTGS